MIGAGRSLRRQRNSAGRQDVYSVMRSLAPLALALTLWFGTLTMPLASVQACSCAGFPTASEGVRAAVAEGRVALIGSIVDTAPAAPDPNGFGPMVRYAVDVERASVPVSGLLEVRALDDGGGASCGIQFAIGERWVIVADGANGVLETGLCSGNVLTDGLAAAEAAAIAESLPFVPDATTSPTGQPEGGDSPLLPVAIGLLVAIGVGGLLLVAFRERSVPRA